MIDLQSTFAQREWGARPSRALTRRGECRSCVVLESHPASLASMAGASFCVVHTCRTLSLSWSLRARLCRTLLVPWQQESVFISLSRRSFVKADVHPSLIISTLRNEPNLANLRKVFQAFANPCKRFSKGILMYATVRNPFKPF